MADKKHMDKGCCDNKNLDNDCKENVDKETIVDLETDDIEISQPELTPLEAAQRELEECKNSMLRLQADFENYKKRNKDMTSKMYSAGLADAAIALFPILDSLDIAQAMYKSKNDKEGIELITKQFVSTLEKLGVKEIDALDKEFDPNVHEAVAKCDAKCEEEKNLVIEVLRKGYVLGDKVLRPTMVKVAN